MADNVVTALHPRSDHGPVNGLILIPPGVYVVVFTRSVVTTRFRRGSLELHFKVADGNFFGTPLIRYYKVERYGKRSFSVSPHSAYWREFVAVFDFEPPPGLSALDCFKGVMVNAEVRTVNKNHRQKKIPERVQYSTISELLGKAK